MAARTVIADFLAVSAAGQVTRTRSFLERIRRYDADSHLIVLEENGAVSALAPDRADLEFVSVPNRSRLPPLRRFVWQNTALLSLVERERGNVYLTFSHSLPWRLPRELYSVVGVSNLAPFSPAARQAEVNPLRRLRLALLKRSILSSARRADRIVALSNACRDILATHGVASEKISVIPNGVAVAEPPLSPDAVKAVLARRQIATPYVLYVSHFYRYKNFERLIEAFTLLPETTRRGHTLVLAGPPHDESYFREIEALVGARGVGGRVRILAGVFGGDLEALYRGATLFVFPSLIENSPNILLEAMAHGVAVAASNVAPMPEFGGDAVRYFDPLSPASIAEAIGTLLADPPARAELGRRAVARAAGYSWDEFTRRVAELYRGR